MVSAFLAKKGTFQGQKEGISANEVLAGNGGESLGFVVWTGSHAPQTVCSRNGAGSLVNVRVKKGCVLNQTPKRTSQQRSWGSDSLAPKDKFNDGRFIGPK